MILFNLTNTDHSSMEIILIVAAILIGLFFLKSVAGIVKFELNIASMHLSDSPSSVAWLSGDYELFLKNF